MITLIKNIFDIANKKNIPFVFIRPKSVTEPDIYQGDFDLLLKPEYLHHFLKLVHQLCAEKQTNFTITRTKREKTSLVIFSNNSKNTVEFDLWTELDIKDKNIAKSTCIAWDTLEKNKRILYKNNQYFLTDDFSALFYLSHLKSKKKDLNNPEVKCRLTYFSELTHLEETTRQLITAADSSSMIKANATLKEQGLLSYSKTKRLHHILHRLQSNIAKRSGTVSVIGPDGVGKTTIIDQLIKTHNAHYFRFKKLFRKALSYKLLLSLTKKSIEGREGKKLAKNQFDDLQCAKLFWIAIPSGYWLNLKARLGFKKIIDRYYVDLLITGSRFDDKEIKIIPQASSWLKMAPTPTCIIQLDAPSYTILKRKEELSAQAIDRFRELYFELSLASNTPYFIYINTQQPIENTFEFLEHMDITF